MREKLETKVSTDVSPFQVKSPVFLQNELYLSVTVSMWDELPFCACATNNIVTTVILRCSLILSNVIYFRTNINVYYTTFLDLISFPFSKLL